MAMLVGFEKDAQGRGLAADPADVRIERLADIAAFADAGWSEKHQKMQMTGGESTDVGFQLGVGL